MAQPFSIEEALVDLVADGPQLTEGRQRLGRQLSPCFNQSAICSRKWINARFQSPSRRLLIDGLAQRASYRTSAAAQFRRDLALALATLVPQMDRASFHTS